MTDIDLHYFHLDYLGIYLNLRMYFIHSFLCELQRLLLAPYVPLFSERKPQKDIIENHKNLNYY